MQLLVTCWCINDVMSIIMLTILLIGVCNVHKYLFDRQMKKAIYHFHKLNKSIQFARYVSIWCLIMGFPVAISSVISINMSINVLINVLIQNIQSLKPSAANFI